LPYTLPQDHTLFVTLEETSPRVWIRKLDLLKRLGGMAMLVTHPDYLDVPSRLNVYQQFCEHVAHQANKWPCLPSEISTWWRHRSGSSITENSGVYSIEGPAATRGRIVDLLQLFLI
jgi:hypothetical protein